MAGLFKRKNNVGGGAGRSFASGKGAGGGAGRGFEPAKDDRDRAERNDAPVQDEGADNGTKDAED